MGISQETPYVRRIPVCRDHPSHSPYGFSPLFFLFLLHIVTIIDVVVIIAVVVLIIMIIIAILFSPSLPEECKLAIQ